ncbi:immunity 53 family protein [Deinococcus sp.]|uniref:immunity 53 family protein n=1 Tax=Deinococcus sp. TaxID=47478 RepID=UPI003CC6C4C1
MTFQKVGLQSMLDSSDPFVWLQGWYYALCDGDWEHGFGPKIYTVDNPGWRVNIALEGTGLEAVPFTKLVVERGEHDWIQCFRSDSHFDAAGGPVNLSEMLSIFREWAKPHLQVRHYPYIHGGGDEQ